MRTIALASCLVLGALVATSRAEPPSLESLVASMKAALEPTRPSIRQGTMRVSYGGAGETSTVVLGSARAMFGKRHRVLVVVLQPGSLRGTAFLVETGDSAPEIQWLYLPAIGRVRAFMSPEARSAFLNSDFTYADLGLVDTAVRYRVLDGGTASDVTPIVEIEGLPSDTRYDGRTVTSIAVASRLPLERKIFDTAGRLWKTERWRISEVDGTPTVLGMSMHDEQTKTWTEIDVTSVRYDVPLPDGLLEPSRLPDAAASPVWSQPGS